MMMVMAAKRGWHPIVHRLKRRLGSGAVILLYHSISVPEVDPQLLRVSPRHFAEHLEILRRSFRPVPLLCLAEGLRTGSVPRQAIVVTFDDGYADNLHQAKPLLERADVPATVFATVGHGPSGVFWWDMLADVFLSSSALPLALDLSINGRSWRICLEDAQDCCHEDVERARGWNVLDAQDPGPRQRAYRVLCGILRHLSADDRDRVLQQLSAWVGESPLPERAARALTPEELLRLSEGGLVEIGAHTITHSVLSLLPPAAQRTEIERNKARLEEIIGGPVASFSYPFGSRSDYTATTVALVRGAGFACACANWPDFIGRWTDPFQLPRFIVRDWAGDEFEHRLRMFLEVDAP